MTPDVDVIAKTLPSSKGLAATIHALEALNLSSSLAEFAQAAWHVLEPSAPLKWGWALDAICEHLEAVTSGEINRLLMNVPPGCMKSLMTGVIWPAWEWTKFEVDPKTGARKYKYRSYRYLGTSHKQELAVRDSMKCRRLITSDWYQARWPMRIMSDQNAKMKFENADTGFREAMAFTSMTGSRGDRVILDDPLSVDDAQSEAELLNAERTFLEALPTRVNNEDSAIVVIMQRLHENDTSGLILSRKLGYCHLMLPMRFEPHRRCVTEIGFKDPRKKDGELLFEERFPEKQVKELERTLGEYATAGQLQQRPSPRGGGLFKTKFIRLWPADRPWPDLEFIIQSYDTAYTEKTANDPSAHTAYGVFTHMGKKQVILLDAWDEHMNYAKLRKKVTEGWSARYGGSAADKKSLFRGRRADALLVEEKSSGISLIQELRTANVPAQAYNPGKADKYARASRILPLYESGIFWIKESVEEPEPEKLNVVKWARAFVKQLTEFGPEVTAHDDYVDTFSQAMIYLKDAGWISLPTAEDPDPPEEAPYGKKPRNPYD